MDAELIFYIGLLLSSPVFFSLGRKVVKLLLDLFITQDTTVTATFRDGSVRVVKVDLGKTNEVRNLVRQIHAEQSKEPSGNSKETAS